MGAACFPFLRGRPDSLYGFFLGIADRAGFAFGVGEERRVSLGQVIMRIPGTWRWLTNFDADYLRDKQDFNS
jgi:hypothetical protein